jgi:hypothetical protein
MAFDQSVKRIFRHSCCFAKVAWSRPLPDIALPGIRTLNMHEHILLSADAPNQSRKLVASFVN